MYLVLAIWDFSSSLYIVLSIYYVASFMALGLGLAIELMQSAIKKCLVFSSMSHLFIRVVNVKILRAQTSGTQEF